MASCTYVMYLFPLRNTYKVMGAKMTPWRLKKCNHEMKNSALKWKYSVICNRKCVTKSHIYWNVSFHQAGHFCIEIKAWLKLSANMSLPFLEVEYQVVLFVFVSKWSVVNILHKRKWDISRRTILRHQQAVAIHLGHGIPQLVLHYPN